MPRGVKAYAAGSGSLAMLAAMRRASSRVSGLAAERRLVGRFHGSNHMPTKIGSLRCSCGMPG